MNGLARAVMVLALFLPAAACQPNAAAPSPAAGDETAVEAIVQSSLGAERGSFCTGTADLLFAACGHEALDDFLVAAAKCLNVSDRAERESCAAEAKESRAEDAQLCREQRAWRREACALLGEARYDPAFDPSGFDDPRHPTSPNPWFPLAVGSHWEYRGGGEVNTVDILDRTKLVAGVTCLVARDLVTRGGDLVEATDDWFALARDGNVWYCGEEVKDYESFDGDDPRLPELVDIDGSFKAGRERDKAGIIFQASPDAGQTYLEEFSLGNAEDATEILSTTYGWGADPELDQLVPEALASLLCAGDCVVTRNFSLLEPGIAARKYYAPGIGMFLEVEPESGEVVQLAACNVDPRCASLPPP